MDDANQEFTPSFQGAALDLYLAAPVVPGPSGSWLAVLALLLAAGARRHCARQERGAFASSGASAG